jgi:uncharacterized protein DUF3309
MSLGTILLIVLIVLLIGAAPTWPYSTGWAMARAGSWVLCWSSCLSYCSWAGSSANGSSTRNPAGRCEAMALCDYRRAVTAFASINRLLKNPVL